MTIGADFLSSAGFWLIIVGLIGEAIVIFVPVGRRRVEKGLSLAFTVMIAFGVAAEHIGDSEKSSPRHLSDSQRTKVITALKAFDHQKFQMITYPRRDECSSTFMLVYGILTDAGWVRDGSPQGIPIGSMQSVLVNATDKSDEQTKHAAEALTSALNSNGIVSNLNNDGSKDDIIDMVSSRSPSRLPDTTITRGLSRRRATACSVSLMMLKQASICGV
jgi:hypothetical protein